MKLRTRSTGFRVAGKTPLRRAVRLAVSPLAPCVAGFAALAATSAGTVPNTENEPQSALPVLSRSLPDFLPLDVLNGSNGFALAGIDAGDFSGLRLADAGDVNGDGFDDFVVGAYRAQDANGDQNGGEAYVVFGGSFSASPLRSLATLDGADGFRLDGTQSPDSLGSAVAGVGDVNGDGFADVLVGAPFRNDRAGCAYVVFGRPSGYPPSIDVTTLDGTNGFTVPGLPDVPTALTGYSVAAAGDLNGDGIDDFAVAAPEVPLESEGQGVVYIVFGRLDGFGTELDVTALDGSNGFVLEGVQENGFLANGALAGLGDVNGDDIDDLLIGAKWTDADDDRPRSGAAWVLFGSSEPFPATVTTDQLQAGRGFAMFGETTSDALGYSGTGVGDVNNDGLNDLLVTAPGIDLPNGSSGRGYVVFGREEAFPATVDVSALDGANGFYLESGPEENVFAQVVGGGADINGDDISDMVITDGYAEGDSVRLVGEAYVVFGRNTPVFPTTVNVLSLGDDSGFTVSGTGPEERAGRAAVMSGDLDGDGLADLLLGARADTEPLPRAGLTHIVYGRADVAGARIAGMGTGAARCRTLTTGQTVGARFEEGQASTLLDCSELGLSADTGDVILIAAAGSDIADSVVGSANGLSAAVVQCANITNTQRGWAEVNVDLSWDCATSGITQDPDDFVVTIVFGVRD